MTTYQKTPTPLTIAGSDEKIPAGTIAYFLGRQQTKFYEAVFRKFTEVLMDEETTKAKIARRLGKDPAQITRWLSGPGNWTLETMGLLLLAMNAEIDPVVSTIGDGVRRNYCHPLNMEEEDRTDVIDAGRITKDASIFNRNPRTSDRGATNQSKIEIEYHV